MIYHVEFKRTAYLNYSIEADSPSQAEDLAWEELDRDIERRDQEWHCNSVTKEEQ